MIQQEQNYRLILNNCKGKELEIARYLHIITEMEEHEARKIVSNLPIILFESLDGEVCSYIEEAFDFYGIKYKMEPVDEWYDIPEYPSKQVIALGLMVDYIGQGTDYANIARKFDFKINGNLRQTPFLVKDGLSEKQAVALKQELRNMGMSAQVIRSSSEIQAIKKRSLLGVLFSK